MIFRGILRSDRPLSDPGGARTNDPMPINRHGEAFALTHKKRNRKCDSFSSDPGGFGTEGYIMLIITFLLQSSKVHSHITHTSKSAIFIVLAT